MCEQTEQNTEPLVLATCAAGVHAFRMKSNQDTVVCVPHIKTMPAEYCDVCPLYSGRVEHPDECHARHC